MDFEITNGHQSLHHQRKIAPERGDRIGKEIAKLNNIDLNLPDRVLPARWNN